MNRFFILCCVVFICAGCADMFEDIYDEAYDIVYEDEDEDEDIYCDGMSDSDGDGYYSKHVYNHGEQFEKQMLCDGKKITLDYQIVNYDVLRVSDCLYYRISEEELLSNVDCKVIEEIPDEHEPGIN